MNLPDLKPALNASSADPVGALPLPTAPPGPPPMHDIYPTVYFELKRYARSLLARERGAASHQTTTLVHEVIVRLMNATGQPWTSRTYFYAAAGQAMRRLLVDDARKRKSHRRYQFRLPRPGGDGPVSIDLLALDAAMEELERTDALACQIIALRFFVGLTVDETAEALDMARRTVTRRWTYARAWLYRRLVGQVGGGGGDDN